VGWPVPHCSCGRRFEVDVKRLALVLTAALLAAGVAMFVMLSKQ
jgi:hypothetical protein